MALCLLLLFLPVILAQNCYAPAGNVSTTDAPCSSSAGGCCPLGWVCLSNGLCHLEDQDIYGRYTCTDRTWQDEKCPQICTHDNSIPGNEAVLQCSDDSWCCDGDRSFDCCKTSGTNFFNLAPGSSIAAITALPSPSAVPDLATPNSPFAGALPATTSGQATATRAAASSLPVSLGASSGASQSPASKITASKSPASILPASAVSSSLAKASSTAPANVRSTLTTQTISSGVDGVLHTATITQTITSVPSGSEPANLAVIIGPAIAVPLGVLLLVLLGCCFYKRRRNLTFINGTLGAPPTGPTTASRYHHATAQPGIELDSQPRSELDGQSVQSPVSRIDSAHMGSGMFRQYTPSQVSRYDFAQAINEEPLELPASRPRPRSESAVAALVMAEDREAFRRLSGSW